MGMERTVICEPSKLPAWERIRACLAERGMPVEMRMIDGALAFPDETPGASWAELRVGTPHGMVTLRRSPEGVTLVIWGNADQALVLACAELAAALAELSEGRVLPS